MTSSGDCDNFSLPIGYKFVPTDEEIICHYLSRKINGTNLESDAVVDMDVYAREPWLFHWEENQYMKPNERYYFVKREKASPNGNGKRPKRSLEGDLHGGWWKANAKDKDICYQGRLVGYMKTLTFHSYKNKNRDRKEAVKTDWIMHEYRLATDTFQEWVLCRIKNNAKNLEKKQGEIEITKEEEEKDQTKQNSSVNGSAFNNMALTGESSTNNMALTKESSTTPDDDFHKYLMATLTEDEEPHPSMPAN